MSKLGETTDRHAPGYTATSLQGLRAHNAPTPQARCRTMTTSAPPLLLPPLDAIAHIPSEGLPAIVLQLAALQAAIAARLAGVSDAEDRPDRLLTVKETAPILGMSEDWLYRHAAGLPFTRRTGRRTLRFSERAVRRYVTERDS